MNKSEIRTDDDGRRYETTWDEWGHFGKEVRLPLRRLDLDLWETLPPVAAAVRLILESELAGEVVHLAAARSLESHLAELLMSAYNQGREDGEWASLHVDGECPEAPCPMCDKGAVQ